MFHLDYYTLARTIDANLGITHDCLAAQVLESILLQNPGANVVLIIFGDAYIEIGPDDSYEGMAEAAWLTRSRNRVNRFPDGTNIRSPLSRAWEILKADGSGGSPIVILSDLQDANRTELQMLAARLNQEGANVIPINISGEYRLYGDPEQIFGKKVQSVKEPQEVAEVRIKFPVSKSSESIPFETLNSGLNKRTFFGVAALTAALLLAMFVMRPLRFVRGWKDVL